MQYNGFDLSDYETVVVSRPLPQMRNVTAEVPSRDGLVVRGATMAEATAQVMVAFSGDSEARRHKIRELSSVLLRDIEARLEFDDDSGLYYMARVGETELVEHPMSGSLMVSFLIPDPVMFGDVHTATVPSGASVEIEVGGTHPTYPRIEASATRDTSTGLWGVRMDDGDFLHVATGSSSARTVALDCRERTCIVNGNATLPTLDSDWLVLEPGTHVLANDLGTGAATVTWIERWL